MAEDGEFGSRHVTPAMRAAWARMRRRGRGHGGGQWMPNIVARTKVPVATLPPIEPEPVPGPLPPLPPIPPIEPRPEPLPPFEPGPLIEKVVPIIQEKEEEAPLVGPSPGLFSNTDMEAQILRAYTVFGMDRSTVEFGAIEYLVKSLTPEMRSKIAENRRRRPKGKGGGQFAPEARGSTAKTPRADIDAWEPSAKELAREIFDRKHEVRENDSWMSRGDWETSVVLEVLGANNPPTLLKTEEFDQFEGEKVKLVTAKRGEEPWDYLTEEVEEFWRAVSGNPDYDLTPEDIIDRTALDPPDGYYIGNGIFGNGTFVGEKSTAANFMHAVPDNVMTNTGVLKSPYAEVYERNGEEAPEFGVMRFKLQPGTKLVDWDQIPDEIKTAGSDTLATWVILNGYHGINTSAGNDPLGGLNILDRSRLVLEYNKDHD
jgi:hypothetical protein